MTRPCCEPAHKIARLSLAVEQKEEKMKKILVVEDGEGHRRDAETFFKGLEEHVEVTYVACYREGEREITKFEMGKTDYDGAIFDIYMPQAGRDLEEEAHFTQSAEKAKAEGKTIEEDGARRILENIRLCSTELIPGGLGLTLLARKVGLPSVMCTAGYHHGARYEWICGLSRDLSLGKIVDGCADLVGEGEHKQWGKAYEALVKEME